MGTRESEGSAYSRQGVQTSLTAKKANRASSANQYSNQQQLGQTPTTAASKNARTRSSVKKKGGIPQNERIVASKLQKCLSRWFSCAT